VTDQERTPGQPIAGPAAAGPPAAEGAPAGVGQPVAGRSTAGPLPAAGQAAGQPSTGRPAGPAPLRVAGRAGIGSIFVLAFLVILVPGIAVYLVTHAAGLALAPSTLLGLLTVIVCLGLYPSVLLRLGWVKKRPRGRQAGEPR